MVSQANENITTEINYQKWKVFILKSQLVMVVFILLTEIADNTLLYLTRSQGYGPDTITEKLFWYLLLPTIIDFVTVFLAHSICKALKNDQIEKYVLIISMIIICVNITSTHYQFTVAVAMFSLPIVISILYEDYRLTTITGVLCLLGLAPFGFLRGSDPVYKVDIGPEVGIGVAFIIGIYLFARLILGALKERREELNQALVEGEKAKYVERVEQMSLQMMETLANAIDAKDRYTQGHSFRVSEYSVRLAEALGWEPSRIRNLKYEALLHDIGKIGVPDAILNKPGRLSDIEYKLIESHTVVGADILKNLVTMPGASDVAKYHHERYNGSGYPEQRAGVGIPINARIVGIADAYDAMSSDRIYRKALTMENTIKELENGRGRQFDPDLLDIFIGLVREGKMNANFNNFYTTFEEPLPGSMLDDMNNIVGKMIEASDYQSGGGMEAEYKEFPRFYSYVKNIGERYNLPVEVAMINTIPAEGKVLSDTEIDDVANAMEVAVQKNIRSVDVCIRCSKTQHLVILLGTESKNVDIIVQRICFDFYKFCDAGKVEVTFDIGMK